MQRGVDAFIVFGAAVLADGSPSGAMRRRVDGAMHLISKALHPIVIVTGGRGKTGYVEADVMAALASRTISRDQIVVDGDSTDTLESVIRCARLLKRRDDIETVTVCTDRYHILRCRWLLWLLGVRTRYGHMPSGRQANGLIRWCFLYVRDLMLFPIDTFLLIPKLLVMNH